MASVIHTRAKLSFLKGEIEAADTFKVALFEDGATIDATTTQYTTTDEAAATGYTAGGAAVTPTFSNNSTKAIVDFTDPSWTITGLLEFRYAMLYDDTEAVVGDVAVFTLDFGAQSVTDASVTIVFPAADATNAIFRLA